MRLLARLANFYRVQFDLVLHWRAGSAGLARRAFVSFAVSAVALAATAAVLPGLLIASVWALALAVVLIAGLSALVRPVLLALVAPFSPVLLFVVAIAFQVGVILAVAPLVPGFRLAEPVDALVAAVVFAVISAILSWLLSLDSDESYYALLMQRLVAWERGTERTSEPGFVIVQIDGLAHPVLAQQVLAGRVPQISRWIRRRDMRLMAWQTQLPSQTSASQAGIMFGNNDDIPAFRWWDKSRQQLFVSNHAPDAEQLEARLARSGPGILAPDGVSIGNLTAGGAKRAYLTMSAMRDRAKGLGHSQSYLGFFLSPYGWSHTLVLSVAEVFKELFQARRMAAAGIEPRMDRGFPYPLLRALTNVVLRPLTTSLAIEEMLRGAPVIYVTYTDYDEIAHHSGPLRPESLDALDGVDRSIRTLVRATEYAPRPYKFVVLSDHGQTLGATFRQRFGHTLDEIIGELIGPEATVVAGSTPETWRVAQSFLTEVTHTGGATAAITRRALGDRTEGPKDGNGKAGDENLPELVVCPSGNLALVSFPRIAGRATLETIEAEYAGLVRRLAEHPGVAFVMVRSAADGPVVFGGGGTSYLANDRIDGTDPLALFGAGAASFLCRLDGMANCGDLVVMSMIDAETQEVAAFEELIGSHGGMGGPQTQPFVLLPAKWEAPREPIIGAPQVHEWLVKWFDAAREAHSAAGAG